MSKNPSANAGSTGSAPGPVGLYMLQGNQACASQLLSPLAATTEAHAPRACAQQ